MDVEYDDVTLSHFRYLSHSLSRENAPKRETGQHFAFCYIQSNHSNLFEGKAHVLFFRKITQRRYFSRSFVRYLSRFTPRNFLNLLCLLPGRRGTFFPYQPEASQLGHLIDSIN